MHPRTALAVLVALLLQAVALPAEAEWASFRADARNTGAMDVPHEPYEHLWWTQPTPSRAGIQASPVAKDGILVVADLSGLVRALDVRTGHELWQHLMDAPVHATPALARDRAYVVDARGTLKSLNLQDGQVVGQVSVGPTYAEIAMNEGSLYIGNEAGEVRAYLADLTHLWTFRTSDVQVEDPERPERCIALPARPVRGKPAVHDGVVYFGALNHYLYAVAEAGTGDRKTGLRWFAATGGIIHASPVVGQGQVFVGSYDGRFHAFDTAPANVTQQECKGQSFDLAQAKWQMVLGGNTSVEGNASANDTQGATKVHSSAALRNGTLYVGANNGYLYAIWSTNGSIRWEARLGSPLDGVTSSPAVTPNTLVVGSEGKAVHWLDPRTGALQRTHAATAPVATSPALDGELAVVAARDGTVTAFGPFRPPAANLVVPSLVANATTLTVVVANTGDQASVPTTLVVTEGNRTVAKLDLGPLEAGQESRLRAPHSLGRGAHTLATTLDPDGLVAEHNELDNRMETQVDVPALPAPRPTVEANEEQSAGAEEAPGLPLPFLLAALALAAAGRRARQPPARQAS